MEKGDTVYIIVSNIRVEPVTIIRIESNLVTVKLSSGGAIRVPKDRLYETTDAAVAKLSPSVHHTPYDF